MVRFGVVTLAIMAGGCVSSPTTGLPYPFSQGLLNPESALPPPRPARRKRATRTMTAPRRARRCRSWAGRRVDGPRPEATRELLACALGKKAARSLRLDRLTISHRPRVGGLVLFDDTRDANTNQRLDDRRSDAGVVVAVRGPRIEFVYLSGTRIRRGVLDLRHPGRRRVAGRVANSYIRKKTPKDPPATRYLAGELLAGFTRATP